MFCVAIVGFKTASMSSRAADANPALSDALSNGPPGIPSTMFSSLSQMTFPQYQMLGHLRFPWMIPAPVICEGDHALPEPVSEGPVLPEPEPEAVGPGAADEAHKWDEDDGDDEEVLCEEAGGDDDWGAQPSSSRGYEPSSWREYDNQWSGWEYSPKWGWQDWKTFRSGPGKWVWKEDSEEDWDPEATDEDWCPKEEDLRKWKSEPLDPQPVDSSDGEDDRGQPITVFMKPSAKKRPQPPQEDPPAHLKAARTTEPEPARPDKPANVKPQMPDPLPPGPVPKATPRVVPPRYEAQRNEWISANGAEMGRMSWSIRRRGDKEKDTQKP